MWTIKKDDKKQSFIFMKNITMEKQIQELIDQHEEFKSKWDSLKVADLEKWLELKESMVVQAINLKSQIVETKATLEKDKAIRTLELKWTVDEKWKTPTEKSIDSTLKLEFGERDAELNALTKYRELLLEYGNNVLEYINLAKLNFKDTTVLPF